MKMNKHEKLYAANAGYKKDLLMKMILIKCSFKIC